MNLRDYLIDQAGKDWAQLLCDWPHRCLCPSRCGW
jgi:hypothetical protein